jgi:hypothetical protein
VNAATVGFVVDGVALTPEPGTGLLAAGAVLAATRRGRRRA